MNDREGERRPDEAGRSEGEGPEGTEGGHDWTGRRAPGYYDATSGHREVSGSEIEAHEDALPESDRHDFEADVERIHRPLFREARAPAEGREPVPWWLWAAAAVALFWGGWYLGRHGGTFGVSTHLAYAELEEYVEEEAAESQAEAEFDPLARGAEIYAATCRTCHQANGRGVPGTFPPLVGAEWATGAPEVPTLILLDGLVGPIVVAGEGYDGVMPSWREELTDVEIAAVLTYVRQMGANDAAPVEPSRVQELRDATRTRQEPWTADELIEAVEAGTFDGANAPAPEGRASGGRP